MRSAFRSDDEDDDDDESQSGRNGWSRRSVPRPSDPHPNSYAADLSCQDLSKPPAVLRGPLSSFIISSQA